MVTDTELFIHGYSGFAVPAVLSTVGYIVINSLARHHSSVPQKIYFRRLAMMAGFVLIWCLFYIPIAARAVGGNMLDDNFWYAVARSSGLCYGIHTIWAWCFVALIDWPKSRSRSAKPPNTALEPTPTAP